MRHPMVTFDDDDADMIRFTFWKKLKTSIRSTAEGG